MAQNGIESTRAQWIVMEWNGMGWDGIESIRGQWNGIELSGVE